MKDIVICESVPCGKEFERERSEINRARKRGRRLFCSRACSGRESPVAQNPNGDSLLKGYNRSDKYTPLRVHLRRAKQRNKDIEITLDDLLEQWNLQAGKCPITGIPMGHPEKGINHPSVASLDRIDPSKGYVPGNIRFVSMWANLARWSGNDRELIAWCRIVADKWQHISDSELAEADNIVFPWNM